MGRKRCGKFGLFKACHKDQRNITEQIALCLQYSNWEWQYFKNCLYQWIQPCRALLKSLPAVKQLTRGRHLVLLISMLSHIKLPIFSKTPFQLAPSLETPVPEWAWGLVLLLIGGWIINREHLLASCYSYYEQNSRRLWNVKVSAN